MISEAELMGLSFPDAPKMITKVPGPKVAALMEESAKYEAFTRGGGGFPVILAEGHGRDGQGRRRQPLYRHGGRRGRQRRGPGASQGARGDAPAVRAHHAHHRHHQPQAHRAGQEGLGHHARGPARRLPHLVLPGRVRRGGDGHQVLPQAHRPHADPRLPGRLPRRVVRHGRPHHRVQLPPWLGAAHRRRPAPPLRLLLPLPVQHDLPQLRRAVRQVRRLRAQHPVHGGRRRRRGHHRVAAGRRRLRRSAAGVLPDHQRGVREVRLPLRGRRGAVGSGPHGQDVVHRALGSQARHAHLGQGHGGRHPHGRPYLQGRDREEPPRGVPAEHLRGQRPGVRGLHDQHRHHHRSRAGPSGPGHPARRGDPGTVHRRHAERQVHRRGARPRADDRRGGGGRPQDQGAARPVQESARSPSSCSTRASS